MKIDAIMPYENNARNNEKAIPVVAESIREFGLKGQIVLESRENPVIVAGHTRWAACRLLGWDEIPDDRIDFCEDMTPDQVKAYRLADNRTGEVATWNKALLKKEIRSLDGFDMERFRFDFKSKSLPYGSERSRTDRAYNLDLVNAEFCSGRNDMPSLDRCCHIPNELIAFNYCKSSTETGCCVHFFIDDYQFERLWNDPVKYIDLLSCFDSVLTPDFSLYMDMPLPMQRWNEYRRRALGNLWQRHGMKVIPTLSWSDERSYGFCFDGIPKGGTVAVSTVGVKRDEGACKAWMSGMESALKRVKPKTVMLYGGRIGGFDFGNVDVVEYKADTAFKE